MASRFVRCMMGIIILCLCTRPALSDEPACAVVVNEWVHNMRHDWDGDGTPENKGVMCALFDADKGTYYGPSGMSMEICECPDGHKTTTSDLSYEHWHFNHSFSLLGLVNGTWQEVTAGMKEAYWDWYYDGYTKVGTYDVTQNCYGHAFGTGTFVNDGVFGAEIIKDDDWADTMLNVAEVAYSGAHVIKVTSKECEVGSASVDIIETSSEKFRFSAIYQMTGDCPAGLTLKKSAGSPDYVYLEETAVP